MTGPKLDAAELGAEAAGLEIARLLTEGGPVDLAPAATLAYVRGSRATSAATTAAEVAPEDLYAATAPADHGEVPVVAILDAARRDLGVALAKLEGGDVEGFEALIEGARRVEIAARAAGFEARAAILALRAAGFGDDAPPGALELEAAREGGAP